MKIKSRPFRKSERGGGVLSEQMDKYNYPYNQHENESNGAYYKRDFDSFHKVVRCFFIVTLVH